MKNALLSGRVAVVTGAADGAKAALGAAFARELAAEGAKILAVDVANVDSVVETIRAAGGEAEGLVCDISVPGAAENICEEAASRLGGLNILVNNAAIGSNIPPIAADRISVDEWDRLMAVNVRGLMLVSRAAAAAMKSNSYGKIVNLGSPMAILGIPNRLHYVAAKGAVHSMTRAMAREFGAYGVRVNTLTPGLPDTDFNRKTIGAQRMKEIALSCAVAEPLSVRAIARALVFLASPDSDGVTGQNVIVDNGYVFA